MAVNGNSFTTGLEIELSTDIDARLDFAKNLATSAGEIANEFFQEIEKLVIEQKGVQDLVSNADKEVEIFVRKAISENFPDDGIVGEEYERVSGRSGYTWVIDPIDGTANFVRGIPAWCVVLACVNDDETKIGVIYEPSNDELFWGAKGKGAYLGTRPVKTALSRGLDDGSIGVGMNGRTSANIIVKVVADLVSKGGIFYRNASGALMLAYVACGRLNGYIEAHMNAWDCLAGQLIIHEAGGSVEEQSANDMLYKGGGLSPQLRHCLPSWSIWLIEHFIEESLSIM